MSTQPLSGSIADAVPPPPVDLVIEAERRKSNALTYLERAQAFTVISADTRKLAEQRMVMLAALIEEAHEKFDPICDAAYKAHKIACQQRASVIDPLDQAKRALAAKVGTWDLEQQRQHEAEERRALEEANRIALEARENEIAAAEQAGAATEEVAAICEMPVMPAPIVLPPAPPKSAVTTRPNLKGRITNLPALVQWVARHLQYAHVLKADETKLNQLIRSTNGNMAIPGVEIFNEAVVRTSTRGLKGGR